MQVASNLFMKFKNLNLNLFEWMQTYTHGNTHGQAQSNIPLQLFIWIFSFGKVLIQGFPEYMQHCATFHLDLHFWKHTRLGVSQIHAAFHLDLQFLEKYSFRGFRNICSIMLHFIWIFTFWKSTCLGVSRIHAALCCISSGSSLLEKNSFRGFPNTCSTMLHFIWILTFGKELV